MASDYSRFVVHCKKRPYDVYIGRPNPTVKSDTYKWGNPFVIGKDGDRDDVVIKYEQWLLSQPDLIRDAKAELEGKILGCWCAPLPCHGHFLAQIANSEDLSVHKGKASHQSEKHNTHSPPSPSDSSPSSPPSPAPKKPPAWTNNDFPSLSSTSKKSKQ